MEGSVMTEAYAGSHTSPGVFVAAFVVTFTVLTTILIAVDFVPEQPSDNDSVLSTSLTSDDAHQGVADTAPTDPVPLRVTIDAIGVDEEVLTPESTDIEVLDRALLEGVVHYPGSGLIGEDANMLLFAHSSYLPVVHNSAFTAFNALQKLEEGDTVTVTSRNQVATYRVRTVYLAEAADVRVDFDSSTPQLTLATCNSFGQKSERYVAVADFVESAPL